VLVRARFIWVQVQTTVFESAFGAIAEDRVSVGQVKQVFSNFLLELRHVLSARTPGRSSIHGRSDSVARL
jgi:hypothetical protein